MCDTFVALRNATRDNSVIFGKNSDRDPNEAHELIFIPHQKHPKGEKVNCTYISIPQVEETNAVLLSKPFWIWGAEMGANEHGVVIGNEAVFTKIPYDKGMGLIGMDHLRLSLERAATAEDALEFFIAGASAVQIGTAQFVNPFVTGEVVTGLKNYLEDHALTTISAIVGTLETPA